MKISAINYKHLGSCSSDSDKNIHTPIKFDDADLSQHEFIHV